VSAIKPLFHLKITKRKYNVTWSIWRTIESGARSWILPTKTLVIGDIVGGGLFIIGGIKDGGGRFILIIRTLFFNIVNKVVKSSWKKKYIDFICVTFLKLSLLRIRSN
jgi:hypothetical protein